MKIYSLIPCLIVMCVSCSGQLGNDGFIMEDAMPGQGKYSDGQRDTSSIKGTKDGDWMVYQIDEGIEYRTFEDFDTLSKANQIVNVSIIDLSSGKYQVKFRYVEGGAPNSSIFKANDALVSINGGYEPASIFVKVDGTVYANIKNDYIGGTSVPQWKSEAAIYSDGDSGVSIEYTAKGMTLEQTRAAFATIAKENVISSSPMLIDNYELPGMNFIERMPSWYSGINISSLNGEDPVRHQGSRHPRTAVGMTEDNHLILMTVDGRWSGVSEGMTAKELTAFFKTHFNPKYALNLDGGGSTTMCVKMMGDPDTHVVNYPTDNNSFDHKGERTVTSHIYIIKK